MKHSGRVEEEVAVNPRCNATMPKVSALKLLKLHQEGRVAATVIIIIIKPQFALTPLVANLDDDDATPGGRNFLLAGRNNPEH